MAGRVTPTPESAWHDETLRAVQAETQLELLAAQDEAGADILDTGFVPVYDEWFQVARAVAGLAVAAPLRYLDTNTYYHHWVLDRIPTRQAESPVVSAYRHGRPRTRTGPSNPRSLARTPSGRTRTGRGKALRPRPLPRW